VSAEQYREELFRDAFINGLDLQSRKRLPHTRSNLCTYFMELKQQQCSTSLHTIGTSVANRGQGIWSVDWCTYNCGCIDNRWVCFCSCFCRAQYPNLKLLPCSIT